MNVLAWILSALLALAYLAAGGMKLATPRAKVLENPRMAWVNDVTESQLKGIGAVEVLGALGLILPWLTGIAKVLTPLAAVGLAIVMVGAMLLHRRRGELAAAAPANVVLFAVAVVVAVIRFSQL